MGPSRTLFHAFWPHDSNVTISSLSQDPGQQNGFQIHFISSAWVERNIASVFLEALFAYRWANGYLISEALFALIYYT
jgi:hypothetical protein